MKFKRKRRPEQKVHPQEDQQTTLAWYPGHMAKAMREVVEALKKVHIVIELRDARLPKSSQNPLLYDSIKHKKHLIVLNKVNLISEDETKAWLDWFQKQELRAVALNSFEAGSLERLKETLKALAQEGRTSDSQKSIKLMIVGLPNTGKSTLINHLSNRSVTRVQDRPGLTQRQQWVSCGNGFEVLDTPGIMRPKIESEEQALCLGLIHALKEDHLELETLGHYLVKRLLKDHPQALQERYNIEVSSDPLKVMEDIGRRLGHLKKGGEIELNRTAKALLTDFRQEKFPPYCLETPHSI